jgi:MoxR-like ATPase
MRFYPPFSEVTPTMPNERFEGSSQYVATDDLKLAVNAAITLQRPLLIKGEPGTGKTMLAEQVAAALGMPLLQWHIKSTTKAQQGLYEYDAVSRLRDSQLGDARVADIRHYIVKGVLWQAFEADQRCVLLIDEVDKADIEFPNDLLRELDRMEFHVYETRETIRANHRRSSSSRRTMKRSCRTRSCAAVFSITSSFPMRPRCSRSSTSTIPASSRTSCGRRWRPSSSCATCRD